MPLVADGPLVVEPSVDGHLRDVFDHNRVTPFVASALHRGIRLVPWICENVRLSIEKVVLIPAASRIVGIRSTWLTPEFQTFRRGTAWDGE